MNETRLVILVLTTTLAGTIALANEHEPLKPGKETFCHDGECIPKSNDPHAPQNFLNHPVGLPDKSQINLEAWQIPTCDGSTQTSPTYAISPAGAIEVTISTRVLDNGQKCDIIRTDWWRDHWTVTCWVDESSATMTHYRCQNWNTKWGDTWHAHFTGSAQMPSSK